MFVLRWDRNNCYIPCMLQHAIYCLLALAKYLGTIATSSAVSSRVCGGQRHGKTWTGSSFLSPKTRAPILHRMSSSPRGFVDKFCRRHSPPHPFSYRLGLSHTASTIVPRLVCGVIWTIRPQCVGYQCRVQRQIEIQLVWSYEDPCDIISRNEWTEGSDLPSICKYNIS